MPEYGMLPIPEKLLRAGVRDMVRVSDARMSGTSYGTCVLHVAPESFVGGPLAFVKDGDPITLDVEQRRLSLDISDEELLRRKQAWIAPEKISDADALVRSTSTASGPEYTCPGSGSSSTSSWPAVSFSCTTGP